MNDGYRLVNNAAYPLCRNTLNIQMLSGRDDAVKAAIGEAALRILVAAFPRTLAELKTSITVQISDIHRASYRRTISYSTEARTIGVSAVGMDAQTAVRSDV